MDNINVNLCQQQYASLTTNFIIISYINDMMIKKKKKKNLGNHKGAVALD